MGSVNRRDVPERYVEHRRRGGRAAAAAEPGRQRKGHRSASWAAAAGARQVAQMFAGRSDVADRLGLRPGQPALGPHEADHREDPGQADAGRAGLPAHPRRQERRCPDQRDARPLARPRDHPGLPGRQGRLRGKAAGPQRLGRPQDDRGGPQVQARRPGRHCRCAAPRTRRTPRGRSAAASSATCTWSASST